MAKIDQEEQVSRDRMRRKESLENFLCNECRQIDLDQVISLGSTSRGDTGVCIQKVGTRFRQRIPTDCLLCQILFDSCIFDKGQQENEEDELQAFHFLSIFDMINRHGLQTRGYWKTNPLQCLAIVPSRFNSNDRDSDLRLKGHIQDHGCAVVYRNHDPMPEIFAVQNVSAQFDASPVLSWFQYCSRNHTKLCSKNGSLVSGLKLIDCESLVVKNARFYDVYVALSYVWGSSNGNNASKGVRGDVDNTRLSLNLPVVILDAIKVTKLLGYRYLWIDKFCIDQDDPEKKHDQIRQMGSVYANAELTIIAAAGVDENYGLPGVGVTPRKAQLGAEIGSFRVLSSMRHPHSSIRSSKWSTRGWTFQEAILSRRRLVFTNEQVYFECNTMNCYESVSIPLDTLHIEEKSQQQSHFRAGVFGGHGKGVIDYLDHNALRTGTFGGHGKDVFDYLDRNALSLYEVFLRYLANIEEYSTRELRYDTDSLNALIGVTRKFEKGQYPYLHVWGLPYPLTVYSREVDNYFACSLTWVHTQNCWGGVAKPRRRVGFPSWSWSGWAGGVSVPFRGSKDDELCFISALGPISFECESGRIVEFSQVVRFPLVESAHSFFPRALILQAHVLPPTAVSYNSEANNWMVFGKPAELNLSQGPASPTEFWRELREGDRWQCILVGSWFWFTSVMILKSHHGIVSRAGMFNCLARAHHVSQEWNLQRIEKMTFRIE